MHRVVSGLSRNSVPQSGGDRAAVLTSTISVGGMDCSSCALKVEKALLALAGVEDVRTDLVGERVTVRHVADQIQRGDLVEAVQRLGYRAEEEAPAGEESAGATSSEAGERWWARQGTLTLVVLSGLFWGLALLTGYWPATEWAVPVLALAAVLTGGWRVFPRGWQALRQGALDMNFLMSVAAVGALVIGAYEEGGSLMFLFAVAQLLEARSMGRARNAIRRLMELAPAQAVVIRDGEEVRVPPDRVRPGEVVLVRPGARIPVDGEIVAGASSVNQAPITGEWIPVGKGVGDEVFAGTLNGEGALEIRSTRLASDTTLARIIHSVEEAQATRAPSQTFVDRFAHVYTPLVVGGAVLVGILPPLFGLGVWGEWGYRALVLLVVACPCALVISTPVTVVSALAGAARRGILIKGGLHLENAGRVRAVALDKTGTLTRGEAAVVDVVALDGEDPNDMLALAASVEARSEHPLARAILRHAVSRGIALRAARDASAIVGRGVRAQVDGEEVYAGSARLFEEHGALPAPARRLLDELSTRGQTAVLVASRPVGHRTPPRLRGVIALADEPRPEAADALRELHRAGIRQVVMLTGDHPGTARAVADALGRPGRGLDGVRAGLLPHDKVAAVRELRREHGMILMVGDGVNDAPALAAADVGVAMGAAGTDVALETADIALMSDDLSRLSTTIRLARRAERIIRANIAFALVTKAAFVLLGLLGYATLWMAVLADMGASLLVVLNGLRASWVPPQSPSSASRKSRVPSGPASRSHTGPPAGAASSAKERNGQHFRSLSRKRLSGSRASAGNRKA
ncbi:MAG TPA: cation-translocating P-type ATPase [Longimicrobiaceae bacterium]